MESTQTLTPQQDLAAAVDALIIQTLSGQSEAYLEAVDQSGGE